MSARSAVRPEPVQEPRVIRGSIRLRPSVVGMSQISGCLGPLAEAGFAVAAHVVAERRPCPGKGDTQRPGFPGCRRWNPTMVRMNSTRKASYASAVALLLAVSPLVLALPAAAAPCKPAGLLPVKICPASPTPGPPSASPAPSVTPPGSTAPPSDPAPPQPPSQSPSQSQVPGQDAAPPTPGPAPSVSQGAPTPPATGSVPVPATAGTSAPQSPDAGQGPESATANPSAAAAGRVGPGPDGQGSLAGGFLLALSGLLIGLSAAIGLRRPARP